MTNIRLLSSCLLAASFGLGLPAHAQDIEKPFIGLDYSQRTYENSSNTVTDVKIPAVRLRAGSEISPWLGVEAHLAVGAGSDDGTIGGAPYTLRSPLTYGVFLRPQLTLGPIVLYGLGGYSYAQFKYSSTITPTPTDSLNDFSFGGGLQVDLGQHWGLNADYVRYVQGFDAISGGVLYHF